MGVLGFIALDNRGCGAEVDSMKSPIDEGEVSNVDYEQMVSSYTTTSQTSKPR